MSLRFNKVTVAGNLVDAPALTQIPSGKSKADFVLAINERTRDGDDNVNFIDVIAWGKTAENAAAYLEKGSPVLIEGAIQQDRWKNQEGQNRSKIKIRAYAIHFLPKHYAGKDQEQTAGGQEPIQPEVPTADEDMPF